MTLFQIQPFRSDLKTWIRIHILTADTETDPDPATQFNAAHVKGVAGSDSAILDSEKVNDVSPTISMLPKTPQRKNLARNAIFTNINILHT